MQVLEQIYNATNNGLEVIRYYFPFITQELAERKVKFRLRDERTPSATIRLHNGAYRITDFGDDGREYSPIDVVMREENIPFADALIKLCKRYGITQEAQDTFRPEKETRKAYESEQDGDTYINPREPTAKELALLGKNVTAEDLKALNWVALASYTKIKDGQATTWYANENYPIFARKCHFIRDGQEDYFYKLYQPRNDKAFRFSYFPAGKKPKNYMNGLHEIIQAWKKLNENELNESTDENRRFSASLEKLPDITICSGERDALCAHARGTFPVWLNSETADLSDTMFNTLKRYASTIYNIPDIDETGKRQGIRLALKFLDLETVWLPDKITQIRDWRGKPYKDLRDFCELYPAKNDFTNLFNLSLSARFWNKTNKNSYEIDLECLYYFLRISDFFIHYDKDSKQYQYLHQNGQVIEHTDTKQIKAYLKDWAREKHLPKPVRNAILSNRITDNVFENLDTRTLQMQTFNARTQYFFFKNETWKVTANGISCANSDNVNCYDYNIIQHEVAILPPMFEYKPDSPEDSFRILSTQSKFLCFLVNSSRIYWREELEQYAGTLDGEQRADFLQRQKFAITSPALSPEQNREQVQCLLSKMFAIGYYLHRYKNPARAWAAYAMDWKLDDNRENNGRSGKSFFFKFADIFLNSVKLSGRNKKLLDNQHVYDQVTKDTEMILIDDCNRFITPDLFFDSITSDLNVNPKNQPSYTIKYEDSPKFSFTTNYVPKQFDPSSVGRLLFLVFSDYYHIKTSENDYKENRQIYHDFNKALFNEYTEDEFNADINFCAQCTQFYMSCVDHDLKPQPNLDNIIRRSYKATMTENFEDWANSYFAKNSTHLNCFIDRQLTYLKCKNETGQNKLTANAFLKQLKAFVALTPYIEELNPEEFTTSNGRIIKNVNGESREMLYLKSYSHV